MQTAALPSASFLLGALFLCQHISPQEEHLHPITTTTNTFIIITIMVKVAYAFVSFVKSPLRGTIGEFALLSFKPFIPNSL